MVLSLLADFNSMIGEFKSWLSARYHWMSRWFETVELELNVMRSRWNYRKSLARVRAKHAAGQPLTVLFIVTSAAKWKVQSLYDVLQAAHDFKPIVGVSHPDVVNQTSEEVAELQRDICKFFRERGISTMLLYDVTADKSIGMQLISPDIVFYQQTWFNVAGQLPCDLSDRALTCYIPYFTPNYEDLEMDCKMPLHRLVYRHFVLNDEMAHQFVACTNKMRYAGEFVGVGHTMLDEIQYDEHAGCGNNCVIYAPHWTINPEHKTTGLNYATFLWNGKEILAYAQEHQDVKWIFKPHPNLKEILVSFNVMTQDAVDAYYAAWEKLGCVELSGGYEKAFNESSAMITDCGSFLTEYAVTGKPIIHLISSENTHKPCPALASLYATYYQVRDLAEMQEVFERVLVRRDDWRHTERVSCLRTAGLLGTHAAQNVLNHLRELMV